jgi:hypothetical protein
MNKCPVEETSSLIQRNLMMDKFLRITKEPLQTILTDNVHDQNDIDYKWAFVKQSIHTAAEETIGTARPPRRNQWFDEECNKATEMKLNRRKILQRKTRALVDK